ncbi:hypothetical protein [Streptomyces sp. KL116D]|uniref:hypothetical protein n=1 Tax=Streptomyces sp. KL116D TaxID=3045152 RepID=UPI0035582FF8
MYYIKAAMVEEARPGRPTTTPYDRRAAAQRSGGPAPAPLVTKDNVDDLKLWGNTVK